ncbi:MAG: MarR family transcriptional regulator [Reichenbachiella sp.]
MEDFAKKLGCLGFSMRMKRLTDALMQDGKRMYKELGLDIEPNWYVIFRLLKSEGELSVMQVAERVGLAHPSVISLTNKMMKAGYLSSKQSATDSRKRILTLTQKSIEKLPAFEKIWNAGDRSVTKVLKGTQFIKDLEILEKRYGIKGFRERTIEELNNAT